MDLTTLKLNPDLAKHITFQLTGSDLLIFAEKLVKDSSRETEKRLKEAAVPEQYLTRQQVADILSLSLTTLWHYENKKILSPLRIGSKVRYKRSDVDAALSRVNKEQI